MEPNSFGDRIEEVIQYAKLTKREFAERIGIQDSTLYSYLKMKEATAGLKKTRNFLKIIEFYPELNAEWIEYGNGDMIKKPGINIGTLKTEGHQAEIKDLLNRLYIRTLENQDEVRQSISALREEVRDGIFQIRKEIKERE